MNDELYTFDAIHIHEVMTSVQKEDRGLIGDTPIDRLCELYHKLFPPQEGVYQISNKHLESLEKELFDHTLLSLVDKGLVDMSVDEKGEFVFSLTEQGRTYAENHFEE